jgi:hypothetical protein
MRKQTHKHNHKRTSHKHERNGHQRSTRKQIHKKSRYTKKRGGFAGFGDLGTNIARGFTKDKAIVGNYYETTVSVEGVDHVIRYIAPEMLFFKTTDPLFKLPEFKVELEGKEYSKCKMKIGEYYITYIIKIQSKKNTKAYGWFALIRSFDGVLYEFNPYSIKAATSKLSNDKDLLRIKNPKAYTKEKNNDPQPTIVFSPKMTRKIKEKTPFYEILQAFYAQQGAAQDLKEDAAILGAEEALDVRFFPSILG